MDDNHKSLAAWIKDAEEHMDAVVYLTKVEKLLTGDNMTSFTTIRKKSNNLSNFFLQFYHQP